MRHSLENPAAYVHSNLDGFACVLEACRQRPPKHLVFASSSSVYGAGARVPFREDDDAGHPPSFYGATKKSNEAMAYSYAHMHGLNITGLRFFTVYGPWGRPDMAPTLFARAICEGQPIRLYNHGATSATSLTSTTSSTASLKVLLHPSPRHPTPPWRIFNIGHNRPVEMVALCADARVSPGPPGAGGAPAAPRHRNARNLRRPQPHPRRGRL